MVGNIVKDHAYGESKEILIGTKHFQPGAKVYMAPANWGDSYENIVVIGCPRRAKHYIEIIMRSEYIENLRLKKVFTPFILDMMKNSEYSWWDDSDKDKETIIRLIESTQKYRHNNN